MCLTDSWNDADIFHCRYIRFKRSGHGYIKDDLLEDPAGHTPDNLTQEQRSNLKKSKKTSTTNTSAFDNPVYDTNALNLDEVEMIGYETKLSGDVDNEQVFRPSLDDYELGGGMVKPTLEFDVDMNVDEDGGKNPALYEYEKL